jgi:hypothetical protein
LDQDPKSKKPQTAGAKTPAVSFFKEIHPTKDIRIPLGQARRK